MIAERVRHGMVSDASFAVIDQRESRSAAAIEFVSGGTVIGVLVWVDAATEV